MPSLQRALAVSAISALVVGSSGAAAWATTPPTPADPVVRGLDRHAHPLALTGPGHAATATWPRSAAWSQR